MLKVTTVSKVSANDDYTLNVELCDGRTGVFDMKPYLDMGVFKELKDLNYFKRVRASFCGIMWPNGQDLSGDTLEVKMFGLDVHAK